MIVAEALHYNPDLQLGDALVALGTGLLALFTWRLARRTKDEVDATRLSVKQAEENIRLTRRQVDLTRESVEAQDRPFVIPTPPLEAFVTLRDSEGKRVKLPGKIRFTNAGDAQTDRWFFDVRLWNMGKGPAVVTGVSVKDRGREVLAEPDGEFVIHAPDGVSDRRLPLEHVSQATVVREDVKHYNVPEVGSTCRLSITYRAASGVRYETTSQVEVGDYYVCRCLDFVQRPVRE